MIFNLIKNKKSEKAESENEDLIKILALLIHAAKIDENYSEKEKKLIISFVEMSSNKKLDKEQINSLVDQAEQYEKNSNQILEFTQKVKKMDINTKRRVVEFLWKIILSDNKSDVYESNLMRRICGLLYLPDKLSGEIKLDIIRKNKNDIHS
tara:strand:- start:595 stop:1050 length:456 start_codon:yes stop_codon:yes gene_type:complete